MKTQSEISELIQKGISELFTGKQPSNLYEPIKYTLEDGGKRMRPLLLMLAAESFGMDSGKCLNQALAIEVFHNFTLLHDDIMDRAPMRRGKSTVHCKWNDNTAILSGDAMVILAYRLLVKNLPESMYDRVLETFNKAALEVCEGQQYDMDFEKAGRVSIKSYLEMIRLKTAVLLGASLEIGAILSGADDKDCRAIYNFGENLGIAFQIQDDLLDTYGDSSVFGKKIGGDIFVGKKTFLLLSALLKATEQQSEILKDSRDYDTVRAIYDKLEVKKEAERAIDSYFTVALEWLSKCKSVFSKELSTYAYTLMHRNK